MAGAATRADWCGQGRELTTAAFVTTTLSRSQDITEGSPCGVSSIVTANVHRLFHQTNHSAVQLYYYSRMLYLKENRSHESHGQAWLQIRW